MTDVMITEVTQKISKTNSIFPPFDCFKDTETVSVLYFFQTLRLGVEPGLIYIFKVCVSEGSTRLTRDYAENRPAKNSLL